MSNTHVSSSESLPRVNQLVTPVVFIRLKLREGGKNLTACRAAQHQCGIGCPMAWEEQDETRFPRLELELITE